MTERATMSYGSTPSAKRMKHARRRGGRSTRHRVISLALARLIDESIELAFSRCSDLP